MKFVSSGEKILEKFRVTCKYGRAVLYVTDAGISIESGNLTVLDLSYHEMISLAPVTKSKMLIVWKEDDRTWNFEFHSHDSQKILALYRQANADFGSCLDALGVKTDQTTEQFEMETGVLSNPLPEKTPGKNRFEKIPAHIPDERVWNDCWFDSKLGLYVTHNPFFKNMESLQNRESQIRYRLESRDDGIVARQDRVAFKFGYPAVRLDLQENEKKRVWFLLPTITEEMLTDELRKARSSDDGVEFFLEGRKKDAAGQETGY
jgi:hypothetical protein